MTSNFRRYSLRALLMLIAACAIPCWWISSVRSNYLREQNAVSELKEICPSLAVVCRNEAPAWMHKMGIFPQWLNRVDIVDVTGTSYGDRKVDHLSVPVDPVFFGDSELAKMMPFLLEFGSLREVQLDYTKTSDRSADELAKLKSLKFLNLQDTKMTSKTVKALETRLPNTEIPFWH